MGPIEIYKVHLRSRSCRKGGHKQQLNEKGRKMMNIMGTGKKKKKEFMKVSESKHEKKRDGEELK